MAFLPQRQHVDAAPSAERAPQDDPTGRTRRIGRTGRRRDERGVAFPSPVVILSVIAVVMAGVAFVATKGQGPTEREITTVARPSATPTETATVEKSVAKGKSLAPKKKAKKKPPPVRRDQVYVVVFNNSGITGLAGQYASTAAGLGWQVVGSDNWYGTIAGSTVYHPPHLAREAKQLALDLGIARVMPAVAPMATDRVTVILTSDAA